MKKIIQDYLESQLAFDSALRDKYDVKKMDKCIEYITSQAREELGGKNGAIPDEKVFHWAREYFLDVADKQEAKAIVNKMKDAKKKLKKVDFSQLEFDWD